MAPVSPLAVSALLILAGTVVGVAVYWFVQFEQLLPLRRRLIDLQRQANLWSREVRAMHDVADTVAERSLHDQSTLGAIVTIAAHAVEADMAACMLLDDTTGELVAQPGAFGLSADQLYRVSLSDEHSSVVRVFKTGKPFWSGDAQRDPLVLAQYAKLWKVNSLLSVPIRREGRSIGVLRMGSVKRGFFTAEHAELLTIIAEEAAVLVETAVLNRRLAETAEQLKVLNRMKDEFVSTVSHEFKTPLTTINGFVSLMIDEEAGPLADQQRKFLKSIQLAARRMTALVGELLDLSKLEAGTSMELQPVALAELIRGSLDRHGAQAADGKRVFDCVLEASLPAVRGDERWLSLVVDNLLSNALKFTAPGGRIRVEAQDRGELVVVSVVDDGIGVPEAERELIFERFHRASNSRDGAAPGTGLGLAIAREVVRRHGGKIWCEPAQPRGTRFSFMLPVTRSLAEAR